MNDADRRVQELWAGATAENVEAALQEAAALVDDLTQEGRAYLEGLLMAKMAFEARRRE